MAFSTDEESQLRSLLTARQAQQQEEVAREKKFEEINAKPVEAISAEDREFLRQYVLVGLQDLYK